MASPSPPTPPASSSQPGRPFAQVLHTSCEVLVSKLPLSAIKGDSLHIKITQSEYEKGLNDCKRNLQGRLMFNKGDRPMTARDLKVKLSALWNPSCPWHLVSLGRDFYEFQFTSYEDMRLAWSMGSINLKLETLRLSKWTNDFNTYAPRQTHAQIWIRIMELPQEYWRQPTLFEIASAVGTPLTLDDTTTQRAFSHYARVLVDIDLSRRLFDEITVERDGYEFKVEVVYECLPSFCPHCVAIGHDLSSCRRLHPVKDSAPVRNTAPIKKPIARYIVKGSVPMDRPVLIPKVTKNSSNPTLIPTAPLLNNIITTLDVNPLRGFYFSKLSPAAARLTGLMREWLLSVLRNMICVFCSLLGVVRIWTKLLFAMRSTT